MARKRTKKLNIHDIHKNNDVEVSHAIQKIKENERKYTAILVLIFMSIFVVLGYFSLRVNYHYLSENNYLPVNSYSTAGEVITLTTDNILSDQEGLLSLPYHYQFSNDYSKDINYQIVLVQDKDYTNLCGCDSFANNNIRYSLDGKTIKKLPEDGVIENGVLRSNSVRDLSIYLWVDDSLSNNNLHYHAFLTIEKSL